MLAGRLFTRRLHTTSFLRQAQAAAAPVAAVPARPARRIGALRGGFTGFLVGVTITGGAAYYYLLDEYNAGQQAILADVILLRESLGELNREIAVLKEEAKK